MKLKNLFTRKMFNKKFWVVGSIILLATVVTIVGLVNLGRGNTYQMALENIAEARFYLKTAGADNPIGNVQLYSGIRESDFQADGIFRFLSRMVGELGATGDEGLNPLG